MSSSKSSKKANKKRKKAHQKEETKTVLKKEEPKPKLASPESKAEDDLQKGIEFEEKSLYSEALKIYFNAVKENPSSTEALVHSANCLVLLDKFDLAEENYKRALSINPFCGDVCYFYSRLLEYRDKYDEALNLCNTISTYAQKYKSRKNGNHTPIHYSSYIRLRQKYNKLGSERSSRSIINTKQKLDKYINEKTEVQRQLDSNKHKKTRKLLIKKMSDINNKINKLEETLLKKEKIVKKKQKKQNKKQTESKDDKKENNNTEKQNGVKPNGVKNKPKSKPKNKFNKKKYLKKHIKADNELLSSMKDEETTSLVPLFNKISTTKNKKFDRQKELLSLLLSPPPEISSQALIDVTDPKERQSLMKKKLSICGVLCNFTDLKNKDNQTCIDNKKDILLEVLQSMSAEKWNDIELLDECFNVIRVNLFRSLPLPFMIATDPDDEDMDFRDPSWEHLSLIYELTFHVVTNTNINKKIMLKYLDEKDGFLSKLINLFSSADDREPQYVKIIVHSMYGRFVSVRKLLRKNLNNFCYRFIYDSKFQNGDITSFQGIPEILELYNSIFQGVNVPVKPHFVDVLRNIIVPLHKPYNLDEFHDSLSLCCTGFVAKDPFSAQVLLGGILKFWPKFNPTKEKLFINEIVNILQVCVRHPRIKQSDPEFATIIIAVLKQFVRCMTSPHHQVAERALFVWRDETIRNIVDLHREKIWPYIYRALQENKEKYWLINIKNINRQIMSDFKRRDPAFFEKIDQQKESRDSLAGTAKKINNIKLEKQIQREKRWKKLKELANKTKK